MWLKTLMVSVGWFVLDHQFPDQSLTEALHEAFITPELQWRRSRRGVRVCVGYKDRRSSLLRSGAARS
jgi:hypothetical protein